VAGTRQEASRLVTDVARVVEAAPNEQNLRHEIEKLLEAACDRLGIGWTAYQLDRTLTTDTRRVRFVDVVHGALVIEYERPGCFGGRAGATAAHARAQAEEYAALLAVEEGRTLTGYVLLAWDGASVSFGRYGRGGFEWEPVRPFDLAAAQRLLAVLREDGVPLVHPQLLGALVGPASVPGTALIPAFYAALTTELGSVTKTRLLFVEWKRLFGQVVGIPSAALRAHLRDLGVAHGQSYQDDPAAYLFALNTYIALVAKLVAALALPGAVEDISDSRTPVAERVRRLESGQLFLDAGVANMLNGDFFSWYADDAAWPAFAGPVDEIIATLRRVSFDVTRKQAQSTRDLFKGLYMTFAPRALRHALGEFYTPDWLAGHTLDVAGWRPEQSLLDPTCGTGTFVLEGLRRRLAATPGASAAELLAGLYGLDLNPLAVLAARASLVVFIGPRLRPDAPVELPVYLADAVCPARSVDGVYEHTLQTERGDRTFRIPAAVVEHAAFPALMQRIRELIDADLPATAVLAAVASHPAVSTSDTAVLGATVQTLVRLHTAGWNGIWCSVLTDRFVAGSIRQVDLVAGNPPWVKWSHLPPEYAEFIKPRCLELGIFSDDSWVGGIESDISTIITYEALANYCAGGGALAFLITGTVFANESSQGFRRWRLPAGAAGPAEDITVSTVEDYAAVAPFEGVSNHPTLLVLRRNGKPTDYPVPYVVWTPPRDGGRVRRWFPDAAEFRSAATAVQLAARPVPGSDAGPWLKGTPAQLDAWARLFGAQQPSYRARKGITTDANGVFFVRVVPSSTVDAVSVSNDPSLGRREVARVSRAQVEAEHVFPLLRGKGVAPFRALPDPDHAVLVPQRGMHGDRDLPASSPRTYRYLSRFRAVLESRSSYRRFQRGQAWWSLWSTGAYTFAPYKVVWQEMSGGRFAAAYIGSWRHPVLGERVVVPDHKVYFVPVDTEDEAAYLAGVLNAPVVSTAITAYAAALSLGVSVVEYLRIPAYDRTHPDHAGLSALAVEITAAGGGIPAGAAARLDRAAEAVFGLR
jgi:Putative RNA methylase family UPF0020